MNISHDLRYDPALVSIMMFRSCPLFLCFQFVLLRDATGNPPNIILVVADDLVRKPVCCIY